MTKHNLTPSVNLSSSRFYVTVRTRVGMVGLSIVAPVQQLRYKAVNFEAEAAFDVVDHPAIAK